MLIAYGANVNAKSRGKKRALDFAVEWDAYAICEVLIVAGSSRRLHLDLWMRQLEEYPPKDISELLDNPISLQRMCAWKAKLDAWRS